MAEELVELISQTKRKSNCHNCRRTIEGIETRLKINYPHPQGMRYFYICKECGTKLLNVLNSKLL